MSLCYIYGSFCPMEEACLPVTDLSIQRGVGVFDSLRTYRQKPFALREHADRFIASAEASGFQGLAPREEMEEIVLEGVRRMGEETLVRLYCTGGDVNQSGIFPKPRFFVLFEPLTPKLFPPSCMEEGIALFTINAPRPNPLVKSIDYMLPYVARGGREKFLEGLYCFHGKIGECTSSTFVLVMEGKLVSAPEGEVLAGVTRNVVFQIAREAGIEIEERAPLVEELSRAEEAFICSTVKEVMPVVQIDSMTIGTGKPGPLALRLGKLFLERVETSL